ncbi:hypothetical protein, partial [Pseudomonas syringae]
RRGAKRRLKPETNITDIAEPLYDAEHHERHCHAEREEREVSGEHRDYARGLSAFSGLAGNSNTAMR